MKEKVIRSVILSGASEGWESHDNAAPLAGFDNVLVESIWGELGGRVDRTEIAQLLLEATMKYREARVRIYLPIMIRRYVLDKLR